MRIMRTAACLIIALSLATAGFAQTDDGQKKQVAGGTAIGAAIGAGAGAAIGKALGNERLGAVAGAVIGGIIGNRLALKKWKHAEERLSEIEGVSPVPVQFDHDAIAALQPAQINHVEAAIGVSSIGFEKDSAALPSAVEAQARAFAAASTEPAFANMNIVLVAYGAPSESPALALQRAQNYRDVLIQNGVAEKRIFIDTPSAQATGIQVSVAEVTPPAAGAAVAAAGGGSGGGVPAARVDVGWAVR